MGLQDAQAVTLIPCSACGGEGKRPLPPALERALAAVPVQWLSTQGIHRACDPKISRSALRRHLNRLVELGLVERLWAGRQTLWRRERP